MVTLRAVHTHSTSLPRMRALHMQAQAPYMPSPKLRRPRQLTLARHQTGTPGLQREHLTRCALLQHNLVSPCLNVIFLLPGCTDKLFTADLNPIRHASYHAPFVHQTMCSSHTSSSAVRAPPPFVPQAGGQLVHSTGATSCAMCATVHVHMHCMHRTHTHSARNSSRTVLTYVHHLAHRTHALYHTTSRTICPLHCSTFCSHVVQ